MRPGFLSYCADFKTDTQYTFIKFLKGYREKLSCKFYKAMTSKVGYNQDQYFLCGLYFGN